MKQQDYSILDDVTGESWHCPDDCHSSRGRFKDANLVLSHLGASRSLADLMIGTIALPAITLFGRHLRKGTASWRHILAPPSSLFFLAWVSQRRLHRQEPAQRRRGSGPVRIVTTVMERRYPVLAATRARVQPATATAARHVEGVHEHWMEKLVPVSVATASCNV